MMVAKVYLIYLFQITLIVLYLSESFNSFLFQSQEKSKCVYPSGGCNRFLPTAKASALMIDHIFKAYTFLKGRKLVHHLG